MRIRRKKWAREELDNSSFYIDKPEEFKGKWQNKFDNIRNKDIPEITDMLLSADGYVDAKDYKKLRPKG